MYCTQCGAQLNYKNLVGEGFCDSCETVVSVSPCKVSFWSLMAVFIMLWTLALPG